MVLKSTISLIYQKQKNKKTMTTLTIATDLTSNLTNVTVSSVEELNKFAAFYGSTFFYVSTAFGWMTLSEWISSNPIEYLF